jgi:hypothetical protein
MIASAPARTAERVDWVGARREPRRRRAEHRAGEERQAEGERENYRRRAGVDRQEGAAGEREREQQARRADGDDESRDAPRDREENTLGERLRHDLPARCAQCQPDRRLSPPRDPAGEQQVRDIGTGDEKHQPADTQENLQAASVLFLHDADAGAGRHDGDDLLRQRLDDFGHPVRRIPRVVLHPLVQDAGEPWADAVCCRARTQAADHAQPRRDRLPQDRGVAVDQGLVLNRDPEIRRVAAERLSEEAGRRDADDGERVPFDDQGPADDR